MGHIGGMLRVERGWVTGESITMRNLCRCVSVLLVLGVVVVGCSRSPEAKKARALERGAQYFERQQYREAIIEYRNALRIDPSNAKALQHLALAHFELGELGQAFPFLLKAKERDPDNLAVRVKLGAIDILRRKPDEAKAEAEFVLEKQPDHFDALLLLAGAADSESEVAATLKRLEGTRATYGDRARFHIAMGTLYLRRQDVAKAEAAFREGAAREPKSVEAHSALGNLHIMKRDMAAAEQEYKIAADLAPADSVARMKLADLYLLLRRPEEAKQVLRQMVEKAPEALPAWRRLAEIAFLERKYDESLKALEPVFKKNPSDLEGRLLRGRVHLAKRETTEAIQEFQQVLKLEPRLAQARHQLALAQVQAGNLQQARSELKEAIAVDPNFADAILLLAELDIQGGAVKPAIESLERLISKHQAAGQAYVLLGSAYLAARDPGKAVQTYRQLATIAPKDPRGPYLVGVALRSQGKGEEARKQFEAALALAPGALDPMAQLVGMAFAERKPQAALDRVSKQLALAPKSGGLHYLLGEVQLARGEQQQAQSAFQKAIELEPNLIAGYVQLAKVYVASKRYDQALTRLDEALKIKPKNVVAMMLMGAIYEQKQEIQKAKEAYEKVLAVNQRFAPAANNLAYLYSEYGGDKEKALELAQLAKEGLPDDPRVSDTLGWILYKRGVYQRAIGLLHESAAKLPEHTEIQYHLGMTQFKLGNKDAAKQALSKAVKQEGQPPWIEEARRTLAQLG